METQERPNIEKRRLKCPDSQEPPIHEAPFKGTGRTPPAARHGPDPRMQSLGSSELPCGVVLEFPASQLLIICSVHVFRETSHPTWSLLPSQATMLLS